MGGNREYFPEIARYRPGTFVRDITVTAGWGFCASFESLEPE